MEQIVPYQLRIVSPIRENDERFMYIQELIEAKRNMLVNKQKKFRFITKQNRFLDVVKHDYEKFYGYISQQKREQIKALEVLDEYIKDLTISGKLTKHNIEDAKEEQLKILRELNLIKESLDTIIDNTQDIVSKKKYYSL
jgi:cell division septum initiation protein DivIVA